MNHSVRFLCLPCVSFPRMVDSTFLAKISIPTNVYNILERMHQFMNNNDNNSNSSNLNTLTHTKLNYNQGNKKKDRKKERKGKKKGDDYNNFLTHTHTEKRTVKRIHLFISEGEQKQPAEHK